VTRVMSEQSRRRFAALPSMHDPDVLASLVAATAQQGLWAELLPLVGLLPEGAQNHVAALAAELDPDFLDGFLTAAGAQDLWPQVLELARRLPKSELEALGQRARKLGVVDRLGPLAELLPAR
jgi:hypothetical protein